MPTPQRFIFSSSSAPEWHSPSFMEDASTEEKETWLSSLIQNDDERLDSHAFLVVLKDLARSNQSGSPQRAEEWMRRIDAVAARHPREQRLQPTVECYNQVIRSWANTGEDASISAIRAERWLSKLGNDANTESYNAFLDSCSAGRGGRRSYATARKRALKAQETLDYMIQQYEQLGADSPVIPNTESFNHVIRAFTRIRDDATVAHQVMIILKQMTEYQRKDPENSPIKPNTKSYTMTLDAFAIAARSKATNCLRSGSEEDCQDPTKNGLQEIKTMQELLAYMHKLHESGGLDYAMPNTVTYNVLITAWARVSGPLHPNAPLEAEKVLRKMISLREDVHFAVAPDADSYTKVILAWTNLGRDTAGKRAQFWLNKLYEEYEMTNDDRLRPTVGAYNAVIKAWSKLGQPENAEMLLVDLIQNEKSEKIPFLKANSESFSVVIYAWLKMDANELADCTQLGERCRRAAKWLNELIWREENGYSVSSTPDLFDNLLKTATKCKNPDPDILDFSISILEQYRASRHRVDSYAYVYLLQIGLNTLGTAEYDDTRFDFLEQLFHDCCDDGLLSNVFVRELANGPVYYDGWTRSESARVVKEFFPEWPLPREWYRNLNHEYYVPTYEDSKRRHFEIRLRHQPEQYTA
jgi:hypothetical protein